jgi:D-inositol-3-phosphate glycosyltransferase
MKIRIIGSAHPLRGGGISTFNERLAGILQEQGHDVAIYSFSLQYPSILFPGKSQRTDEPAPAGLKIHSIINSVNPLNWFSVGRKLRDEKPDLVIVRFWTPFMGPAFGTVLQVARKNRHTRILAITDNVVAHEKKAADLILTKYFFKPVHAFLTMSSEVMRDLRAITQKPAVQLFHPLYDNYGEQMPREEALRSLSLDPAHRYIMFFGFIRKYKGLDLLLEALADPATEAADIHLIVAGEYYGDQELYEGLIRKHRLENRVHLFTGFIPNDEIRRYFGAADCVVLPYRTATQSGITQTAYHFGRGMVATRVGGLPEFVEDGVTGILCEPQPAAIAQALVRYFEPGIPHLEENLTTAKEKYSWPVFTEKLLAFAETIKA